MRDIIEKSFYRSFKETLGINLQECSDLIERGFTSEIHIDGDRRFSIYIVFERGLLVEASNIMLFDDNPDEETIIDLGKELTNIVVGLSKVVASDENIRYNISTPTFLGDRVFDREYNSALGFICNDKRCSAYICSINRA